MVKPLGLAGAIFAAVLGGVVWGAISYIFDYEFGFVAWGIGAGVGLTSLLLGSRGILNGVICAVLTLLAIAAGKVLPYYLIDEEDLAYTAMDEWLDKEHYDEIMLDAKEFQKVKSEKDYPKYMVDRFYTDEEKPADVHPEEIEHFKENFKPNIDWAIKNEPTFEEWRAYMFEEEADFGTERAARILEQTTFKDYLQYATEDLTHVDILFILLGVGSAFGMGRGKGEATQHPPSEQP